MNTVGQLLDFAGTRQNTRIVHTNWLEHHRELSGLGQ